ncbi:MAG: diguanylate cyclase [Leptospirales bacterium]
MQNKKYKRMETLFTGKHSSIIRAKKVTTGETVIIRAMNSEFPQPIEVARLKHEYKLLNDLNINGVIKILAYEKLDNYPILVMEDFKGEPLNNIIEDNTVSLMDRYQLAAVIAGILAEIHNSGIIHKDINPNNILFNPETGVIKVIDFEIATRLTHENQELTNPDHLEGTLAYISPEQTGRMNRPIRYQSDIYSLGVTFYELFSRKRPFIANDNMELVHMHIAKAPKQLYETYDTIPKAISDVVLKMMAKNAEDRYKSAFTVKSDFEKILTSLNTNRSLENFRAGMNDTPDIFKIPDKLYGRESEIQKLLSAYESVCNGQTGIMLVSGYSGVGKSSLIHEIYKPITESTGHFINGKFEQYKRNIPYSAVIQAFQDLIRQILTQSDSQIEIWKLKILEALEGSGQIIIDVLPQLEIIIGEQPEVPTLGALESQNMFNFYFKKFVQVFGTKEHPLAMFLDDLHWADAASLNLIEIICTDTEITHLFVIGAYRSNEVDLSHPLLVMLARFKKANNLVNELLLLPFSLSTVQEIICDTFLCTEENSLSLAEVIHKKTNGNPLFINQLLIDIYQSKLAMFSVAEKVWTWDIQSIQNLEDSDNVIDLMIKNIKKLPEPSQQLIKRAACIGNKFTHKELLFLLQLPHAEVITQLTPAVSSDLIQPIGDNYKYISDNPETDIAFDVEYRFLHDRVQQAAYDMLSSGEKSVFHLKIGKLRLAEVKEKHLSEYIFEIVNHYDLALDLIVDAKEKLELAKLNLQAAIRAKESIAYEPALRYIQTARNLLKEDLFKTHNDFWHKVNLELAEIEHLCGNHENAKKIFNETLEIASNRDQKSAVYEKMIHFYTNLGDFKTAYQTGRKAVRLYGVKLPSAFIPPLLIKDFIKLKIKMAGKKIEDLVNLSLCENEDKAYAMKLIAALLKAAYQIRPELCIHNAIKGVTLSLKYGNIKDNAVSYLVYGGIFRGGVLGNHQSGYEFGRLALSMNEKFDYKNQRSEINFVSAYFTNFWLRPVTETEEYYKASYESGLHTGDFFHVSCAVSTLVMSQFIRGVNLDEVKKIAENFQEFMHRIANKEAVGTIQSVLSTIANLNGLTSSRDSFSDNNLVEEEYIKEINTFTALHFSHFYYVNKMFSLYLWGNFSEAYNISLESKKYLKYSLAMLHTTEHYFITALILSALYNQKPRKKYLKEIRKIQKKIKSWADKNPVNFGYQYLLVSAELEKHKGKVLSAIRLYEEASQSALKNGFIQKSGIANELAGRLLVKENNKKLAWPFLRDAISGYSAWGAKAIAEKTEAEFSNLQAFAGSVDLSNRTTNKTLLKPENFSNTSVPGKVEISSTTKSLLDIDTVVKATVAISSEIKFDSLLKKLMHIIIENAGAQRGIFISNENNQLWIEAEDSIEENSLLKFERTPAEGYDRIPFSMVQFVSRTSEVVMLTGDGIDHRFENDSYFKKNQIKSVLCTPVRYKGEVTGIIYLENNLTSDAFTESRIEMLEMISTQAAISIENARHYETLEDKVIDRTRIIEEEKEKLKVAMQEIVDANRILQRLAVVDALTGLANRRHFDEFINAEWDNGIRDHNLLSLIMIDIDFFKKYNDGYGHQKGDECIKIVADAIRGQLNRPTDIAARYGGEEFAVILPNTTAQGAFVIAENIQRHIESLALKHDFSEILKVVTVSEGVATIKPTSTETPGLLIERADKALYAAKHKGRNRVKTHKEIK